MREEEVVEQRVLDLKKCLYEYLCRNVVDKNELGLSAIIIVPFGTKPSFRSRLYQELLNKRTYGLRWDSKYMKKDRLVVSSWYRYESSTPSNTYCLIDPSKMIVVSYSTYNSSAGEEVEGFGVHKMTHVEVKGMNLVLGMHSRSFLDVFTIKSDRLHPLFTEYRVSCGYMFSMLCFKTRISVGRNDGFGEGYPEEETLGTYVGACGRRKRVKSGLRDAICVFLLQMDHLNQFYIRF